MRFLEYFKSLFIFIYHFTKIGREVWRGRIKFSNKPLVPDMVVVVYFNPAVISDPENALIGIRNAFFEAYKTLHSCEPIVIMLPFGYSFNSMDMVEFIDILPSEVRERMMSSMYKHRQFRKIVSGTAL